MLRKLIASAACAGFIIATAALAQVDGGTNRDATSKLAATGAVRAKKVSRERYYKAQTKWPAAEPTNGEPLPPVSPAEGPEGGPSNDDCAAALPVGDGMTAFSNVGASTDGPPHVACQDGFTNMQVAQDIWYDYTATCTNTVTVSLCGSSFDTKLAIYDGCACPVSDGNLLVCEDDTCGLQSQVTFGAATGNCYKVRVGGYGLATGSGTMTITCGGAGGVPNDLCADAIEIFAGDTDFSTIGALTDGPAHIACQDGFANSQVAQDIWYEYTATGNDLLQVSLCAGTDYDSKLAAYDGCACPVGDGNLLACDDDGCGMIGGPSIVTFNTVLGNCYKIRVGGFAAGVGAGVINISTTEPLPNDACADAVPVGDGDTAFSTVGATTDGPDHPQCYFGFTSNTNQDIWFDYTATCTDNIAVSLCNGTSYDSKIAVYDGCGCPVGDANLLACDDDTCTFIGPSATVFPAAQGNCYKIRVGGFGAASGAGVMNIACGGTIPSNCCVANGGQGCDDADCQAAVCAVDPFCCNVQWDGICAGEANDLCAVCGGVPPVEPVNNACASALPLPDGDTAFDTAGATTDGLDHPNCGRFASNVNQDIWYDYSAGCSGQVVVSLCAGASYDSKLAVYDGCACPVSEANLLACDDDFCVFAGPSEVSFTATAGACYKVRVGGFGSATGAGTINVAPGCAAALVDILSANPPTDNPYVTGQQAYRDVLDTGNGAVHNEGIGAVGTPAAGTVTFAPINVTFSGAPSPAPLPVNVSIACTGGACPTVTGVSGAGAGPYAVSLSGPIPTEQCTTLTFAGTNAGQKLQYQHLPTDFNLNGVVAASDVLLLVISINNGTAVLPANLPRFDVNRSGGVTAVDVLRAVQQQNGLISPQAFLGASAAACP